MPILLALGGGLLTLALYRGQRRRVRMATTKPMTQLPAGDGAKLVCWATEQRSRRADEEARRQQSLSTSL